MLVVSVVVQPAPIQAHERAVDLRARLIPAVARFRHLPMIAKVEDTREVVPRKL